MINYSFLISLSALLFYGILLIVIFRREYRNRVYQSFGLYLLSMIVWSFGSLMMFADIGQFNVLFWNRFMVVGSSAMPIAFFDFVQKFLSKKREKWLYLGLLLYLGTQLVNFTGYLITDAYVVEGLLYNQYGTALILPSISWVFFIGFSAYDLVQEYRGTKDVIYLNRIRYLLIVILVIFLGSLTNATELKIFPFDIGFNIISALLIAYAILRHQLLDISVVVRKGLLYSIPTIIIGASYFLIISLALRIFNAYSGIEIFLLSLIVAIITALVAQPFRDKAQAWIDKMFFRDKYDTSLMLQRISQTAATYLDIDKLTSMIFAEVTSVLHVKKTAILTKTEEAGEFILQTSMGMDPNTTLSFSKNHPIVLQLSNQDKVLTKYEIEIKPQFKALWEQESAELNALEAEIFIPLKVQGELVGIFVLGPKLSEESYSLDDQLTLITLANQTAVAIQNARLYALVQQELNDRKRAEDQLHLQLQRMNALHTIDMAITASLNLQVTLGVLLDVIVNQLDVDAAAVLLFNKSSNYLEYTASRGFMTSALKHTRLKLGDGLAGRAAIEQRIIHVHDLNIESTSLHKSQILVEEKFISYFGIPLVAKGEIKGVLEIFQRSLFESAPEWTEFLNTLATQTAIALDNAEMFQILQQSNLKLIQAYETTLEGWSRALELRDKETEGHTQRVTEMTLELARSLEMEGEELIHMKRGALLHDIGKMGIPDSILLKSGPLTQKEKKIMQQHTTYAFKLLITIPFLRPALDIPQYHHEKWDGSGYPQELKGEEIPLAARVFAVVDVWDALVSDRPYRSAKSHDKAISYIKENSGKHFDPMVVDAFLRMLEENPDII